MKLNLSELLMLLDENNDDTEVSIEVSDIDEESSVKVDGIEGLSIKVDNQNGSRSKKLKLSEEQVHQILDNLMDMFKAAEEKRVFKNLELNGFRVLHQSEQEKLSVEGQGYLLSLEHAGLLTPKMREEVIHQVMQLDTFEVEPEFLNWLVVNAGINQAEPTATMTWLRDFSAYQSGKIH
ncbi:MAG: DUF494 family protein [Gammaproteobacteria bacterium]